MTYVPHNVLITGGCGFIGSNFVNHIHDAWPNCNFVNVDKLILNSDTQHVDEKIDTVIHFAADCTSTRCYNETIEAIENNVIAFIEFLEAAKDYGKIKKFVHISTDEVYGDSGLGDDEKGKVEASRLLPGNPYAATKIAGEAYVRAFTSQYKLPIITARMNNIYGPNQWDVKVVPRFIEIAKVQGKYTIQGSGKQLRYANSKIRMLSQGSSKLPKSKVNILFKDLESNLVADLAQVIQAEVDRQLGREVTAARFISIPDRPYNDMRYLIDISKAEKELGWTPQISFEEGMRRTVASALKPKDSVKMHVALYGGNGYVGQALQKVLNNRKVPYVLAKGKVGFDNDKDVSFAMGIHFTYVGTGYIFAYDAKHPIGGKGFTEEDIPTFSGSSYSVVKGFTDRQMSYFNDKGWENINARITLPLTYELDQPRNLLSKIINYKLEILCFYESVLDINCNFRYKLTMICIFRELFDLPVSISILPDCFEAMISLMEKRFGGHLNLVNPGPISLYEIVLLYKEVGYFDFYFRKDCTLLTGKKKLIFQITGKPVDPQPIGIDTERGQLLLATKGNCALDSTLLESMQHIPSARESLANNFARMKEA
ncbi:unnamed protein product [Strongylus vulgaris]|uniref:NAD(P)-binding domain-containing protein n=1 Tax=Strongylus vulgaris TaxID=40348 RepID=A0A3P7J6E2_STRVU|nr:unnamed protein product [Strongylus vulgaris]